MVKSRRERRIDRIRRQRELAEKHSGKKVAETAPDQPDKQLEYRNIFSKVYGLHYKKLIFIPIALLILAFIIIGMNIVTTGDFMNKGVSLKGGLTITIPTEEYIDIPGLESALRADFSQNDIIIQGLSEFGNELGVIIEADIESDDRDSFVGTIEDYTGLDHEDFSIEEIGSSLGESFFRQTIVAILLAFLFMGLVVFWYFRTFVPSMAVILAAFSDIIVTLAIVDLFGIKISTAGIAAFLMLIGYSVDTDILLSTRVLKKKEGTVMDRVYSAMRTGLTMNLTTMVAVTAALILADSETIRQIMIIILVGLFVDIINTWIQNVSILRYYLERKGSR